MIVPEDYQFTDNVDVNIFTDGRATLLFGSDWKSRDDLMFSQPERDVTVVCGFGENDGDSWLLEVKTRKESSERRYSVCCMQKGKLQDPAPNLAATVLFYENGTARRQIHYAAGTETNPPDGSPLQTDYRDDGSLGDCWYVNENGSGSRLAYKGEMAERIRVARNSNLRELCTRGSEIVTLESGSVSRTNTPSVTTNLQV